MVEADVRVIGRQWCHWDGSCMADLGDMGEWCMIVVVVVVGVVVIIAIVVDVVVG